MDSEEARQIIIEYVAKNPRCTTQDIVDGVKDKMSRMLVFRYKEELVKEKILEDTSSNRRDHRYIVSKNNPLLLLIQQLDEFETPVVTFVENAKEKYEKEVHSAMEASNWEALADIDSVKDAIPYPIIKIFTHVVSTYSTYALFKWPSEIKDKELLQKMNSTLFAKLNQIASRLSGLIEWTFLRRGRNGMISTLRGEPKSEFMHEFDFNSMLAIKSYYTEKGLATKEYETIMDIIWKISSHILPDYVKINGWKEAFALREKYGVPFIPEDVLENPDRYR